MLFSWQNYKSKFLIKVPPQPVEESGNPASVSIGLSEGATGLDNTNIVILTSGTPKKIAIEVGNTGIETIADAYNWTTPVGVKGTPIAIRDIGGDDDGTAGFNVLGSPIDFGTYYYFSGSSQALRSTTDLGDSSNEDAWAVFRCHNRLDSRDQVIWQDGANTNGIAIGIDASGNLGIFGRASGVLSSITIPPTEYDDDVWYELWATRTKVTLLDYASGNVIAEATGTCTSANGSGLEGIANGTQGSAISGSGYGYFEGDIAVVEVYQSGDLTPPEAVSGKIFLPASVLSQTEETLFNVYVDPDHIDNDNITIAQPGSYWDAATLVTWALYSTVYIDNAQVIPSVIQSQHTQIISMAARLYNQFAQILATARRINIANDQVFDTTTPLYLQNNQVFDGYAAINLALEQVLRVYGPSVTGELLQNFASHNYDIASLQLNQVLGSEIGAVLQDLQFSAVVAGTQVGVTSYKIDRSGFAILASLQLRDRAEWRNKQVGDQVVITLLGEQYNLIVVNKLLDEQYGVGTCEFWYQLECMSATCQLAEGINPDISASRVTASFSAGTWASDALDLLTAGVCHYNLSVPDFQIGAFDFKDSERFAAIRQIFPAEYGWIIETSKDGVLEVKSWVLPELGGTGHKTLTFESKALTPPAGVLYNKVELRNYSQQEGSSGLSLEVVDNGDGTGTIYGYSVPWTDAFSVFDSDSASAPSLLITGGAVETVEVEDTDVEFVNFAANLSKPCYSSPVIDWGNNDILSPVTYTESRSLSTATDPGYSVAVKATYTTRRKVWTFDNRKTDVSQVRIKYD